MMSRLVSYFAPAESSALEMQRELQGALHSLQRDRFEALAEMSSKAGQLGARIARVEESCSEWRAYARELEKIAMAAGLELPAAPDDHE